MFPDQKTTNWHSDSDIDLLHLAKGQPALAATFWFDLNSEGPIRLAPASHTNPQRPRTRTSSPTMTPLNHDVMLCHCPECGAPMTLRMWLSVADCWRCGVSIVLTIEQVRAFNQTRPSSGYLEDILHKPTGTTVRQELDIGTVHAPPVQSTILSTTSRQVRPTRYRSPIKRQRARATHWLQNLPAWMVSAIIHMVLLMLFALLMVEAAHQNPFLVLSTEISPWHREGSRQDVKITLDEVIFDLPIPPDADRQSKPQRLALIRANQEAQQLRLDPMAPHPELPDLDRVKKTIVQSDSSRAMLATRDPRLRVEMIRQEGGTTLTEAAVARGLHWLQLHQNQNGSWSLDHYHQSSNCESQCTGHGRLHSDTAGTALVLLPFLGAGQTHLVGRYQDSVSLGLRWLIEHQEPDGDLRADSSGNAGMYAHGQAAIVLCEAYSMTGDAKLREAAQRSIDFIVAAQHEAGGWRYQPGEPGDTSVLGWQLMALQSARSASLNVPSHTLENAGHFLDSVGTSKGNLYAYMPGKSPTPVMTAEALLCRMYLGWELSHVGLRSGVNYLIQDHLPQRQNPNIYYWYYATQVMHHVGGTAWKKWNHSMRDVLVSSQEISGHAAGSWNPQENHDNTGGRLYTTALATCTLEVYYRHVPIFRRLKLD